MRPSTSPAATRASSPSLLALCVLFFLSGFAGLVYQVLWLRQLGLLFGNTAYAAAMTLTIFFLGLTLGSWFWGNRAATVARPLRAYALLELAIAATAVAYFGLLDLYYAVYGTLFRTFGSAPFLFTFVKAILATGILLPPAVFMGGTLPMMGQHVVRGAEQLGRRVTLLYGINTAGGALGALSAGFYLPPVLGFTRSYWLAIGVSIAVGVAAYAIGASNSPLWKRGAGGDFATDPSQEIPLDPPFPKGEAGVLDPHVPTGEGGVLAVAFLSGFATLGLEVLWTKMFAQVLHNSVYSFSAILVTFLVALALGSFAAHLLCRRAAQPAFGLVVLLLLAGALVGLTPYAFHFVTDGLSYVAPKARWHAYILSVFANAATVMLLPAAVIGTVFPYLLALTRLVDESAGKTVGRLVAVNTSGAILGSLAAGFVLLGWLGLWASIKTMALLYFAAAAVVSARLPLSPALRALPLGGLLLFATALDSSRLPLVRLDPRGECLHEMWEGPHGVVAVVERGKNLRLKVDNYYSLGGTGAFTYEQTQADIPIVMHPNPKSIFFLGLGTGITAGAALFHPVAEVTAAELIPEVVTAARGHFAKYINGLFEDPRARVVFEDGRHFLLGTDHTYDVIVGDLFIPWQAGAGSLYTKEHFEAVARRLAPGGLFAQWLPLYQLSRDEALVITRTMLEVFPQLTLWRGDFLPGRPIVALVGQLAPAPLDPEALVENFRRRRKDPEAPRQAVLALTAMFYVGNLGANRDLFSPYLINVDDRPLIEYSAPITQREQNAAGGSWFTGRTLSAWYDELSARVPPEKDPYLARLKGDEYAYVRAGHSLFKSKVLHAAGDEAGAKALADQFSREVPYEVYRMFQSEKKSKKSEP
jgi:spermidine synthase